MSYSAFARSIGVSQPYVSQLVAKGVLVPIPGTKTLDPEAAKAAIEQHRDPAQEVTRARHAAARADGSSSRPARAETDGEPLSYADARAKRERAQAELAEFELRRRMGSLIQSDRVTLGETAAFMALRQRMESLPSSLAARLAAEPDVRKCHALMVAAIREALNLLADELEQMAASRQATQQ